MLANSRYQCQLAHEKDGTACPKSCEGAEDPSGGKEDKENTKPKSEEEVKAEVKRRMAAKLASQTANRKTHNAKKIQNTIIALKEAQKELLTKEKMAEQEAVKKQDELPAEIMK